MYIFLIVEEYYRIPSIFTYKWKGEEIVQKIKAGYKVYLTIEKASQCRPEEPSFPKKPSVMICVQPAEPQKPRDMPDKPFWNWKLNDRINGTRMQSQKPTPIDLFQLTEVLEYFLGL